MPDSRREALAEYVDKLMVAKTFAFAMTPGLGGALGGLFCCGPGTIGAFPETANTFP
jgi:hypothetical protein